MIQFENVTTDGFEYISFETRPGTSCRIIVNSGYDKEMLLAAMLGLRKPEGGRVFVLGKNIYETTEGESNKVFSRVGVAWKDGRLISNLKVWENVILPSCYHQGKRPEELEEKVLALCRALKMDGNISGLMGALPGHLSQHERRLAGLMRAMLLQPELIIYDSLFEDIDTDEMGVLTQLTKDFQLERPGRVSVYISSDEESLQHMETDMTLKQVKRELRVWKS